MTPLGAGDVLRSVAPDLPVRRVRAIRQVGLRVEVRNIETGRCSWVHVATISLDPTRPLRLQKGYVRVEVATPKPGVRFLQKRK